MARHSTRRRQHRQGAFDIYRKRFYHRIANEVRDERMKPDLLIFDLDGTLADTKHDIATAVNLTLAELGLPRRPLAEIHGYVGGGVRRLLQHAVGENDGPRLRETLRLFRCHYLVHLLDTTRLYPGMADVLEYFGGRKKSVATNKPQVYTDSLLKGLSVYHLFDLVLGADSGLALKPEPEMILEAVRRSGVPAAGAVMIGDSLNDIHAARAAGVPACAVGYGMSDPDELRAAGPEFFAARPEDLMRLFR